MIEDKAPRELSMRVYGRLGHVRIYAKYCSYYQWITPRGPLGPARLVESEDYQGRAVFAVVDNLIKKQGDVPQPRRRGMNAPPPGTVFRPRHKEAT